MSNTRNTGYLTNIIQYTPSGNISFVSGSTTLMSISSSGAITTTGVISGSNAATASSVANLNQNVQITGSLGVTSTITAQTLNVQTVTSSIVYSSGSNVFGNSLSNTQQMTGSLLVTGSTATFAGNVGVGTASPDNTYQGLTIFGSNPSLRLKTSSSGGWTWTEYVNSSGTNNFSVGVNQSTPYFGIKAGAGMDNPNLVVSSAGNVGIGISSPNYKLDIAGTAADITSDISSGQLLDIYGGTISSANYGVGLGFTRAGSQMGFIAAARENTSNEASFMSFATQTSAGTHPERMRITSGGNVGIGTSFVISPYLTGAQTSGVLQIATNIAKSSTATTDSYPVAFIGSNDATYPLGLYIGMLTGASTSARKVKLQGTEIGLSPNDIVMQTDGAAVIIGTTTKLNSNAKLQVTGEFYMGLAASGAGNSTLKYNTSSGLVSYDTSARIYKKDIIDLEYGLDEVLRMSSKKYKWKSNDLEDLGFIADEMYQVVPEVVYLADNKVNKTDLEDGEPMGINYDRLVPVLVKAIQELKAENDSLKEILQRNNIQ